jgi:hypothetical protein
MNMKTTIYTAVGHLLRKRGEDGASYPIVLLGRKEYGMDVQELVVWAALCWQLRTMDEIRAKYIEYADKLPPERRTLEDCVARLKTRGLIACGEGDTGAEALYDLLSELYVIPVSEKLTLRFLAFWKLVLGRGVAVGKAAELFHGDRRDEQETRIMALVRQAVLSTAELIKCVEVGASDISTDMKLLEALYVDPDVTCDNLPCLMRSAKSRERVTVAVANLYLRKQVILDRV